MDINRNDRNVYFSCTRGSIIQDVNRGKNATTVRPGGTPRITRPRDESLRSSSFYQPRFSQTEIRFESSLHRLMYAATVGCQVRDTDALFMQHRKVNISTKRRRRHRARSPSSWLRAYFSRMDNYPEGVTLRGEESRVASVVGTELGGGAVLRLVAVAVAVAVVVVVIVPPIVVSRFKAKGPRPSHPEPRV